MFPFPRRKKTILRPPFQNTSELMNRDSSSVMVVREVPATPKDVLGVKRAAEEYHELLSEAIRELRPLVEIERLYVFFMLATTGNNKSVAAEQLQVDRRSIQRWLKNGGVPTRHQKRRGKGKRPLLKAVGD